MKIAFNNTITLAEIINLAITILSIALAIIAILQTRNERRLSNKHQLFERRLAGYLLLKEIVELYDTFCRDLTIDSNKLLKVPHETLSQLTNSPSFTPLYKLSFKEAALSELPECNMIKQQILHKANALKCVFHADISLIAHEFIKDYMELCIIVYKLMIDMQHTPANDMKHQCESYDTEEVLYKLKFLFWQMQNKNILQLMEQEMQLVSYKQSLPKIKKL